MPETCSLGNSCASNYGFTWPPAGWVRAQPASGLPRTPCLLCPHLHTPDEDPAARAVDGSFAGGDAIGTSQLGREVLGVAGEDVDEAHVALLIQQTGLRRAHFEQLETFPLPVSLREVAEQLALVVGEIG